VLQGVAEIGVETVKEEAKQAVEIVNTIITGQELVGNARPMSEAEMAKAKAEDEKKKEEGIENELKNIPGRDVGGEIKQIVEEKKSKEEQDQQDFLRKIEEQRQAEEAERNSLINEPGNTKREAAKTQFAPGKRKKQRPDASQMSQTSEFKGGKID